MQWVTCMCQAFDGHWEIYSLMTLEAHLSFRGRDSSRSVSFPGDVLGCDACLWPPNIVRRPLIMHAGATSLTQQGNGSCDVNALLSLAKDARKGLVASTCKENPFLRC